MPIERPAVDFDGGSILMFSAPQIINSMLSITLPQEQPNVRRGQFCRIGNRSYRVAITPNSADLLLQPGKLIGTAVRRVSPITTIRAKITPNTITSVGRIPDQMGPWTISWEEWLKDN